MSVISVSLPSKDLSEFDNAWKRTNHSSRSDAVRAALHNFVVQSRWKGVDDLQGHFLMSIIYTDKKKHQVLQQVHAFTDVIHSSMHTHFEDMCVEQLVLKGGSEHIHEFVEKLNSIPGVKVCNCTV